MPDAPYVPSSVEPRLLQHAGTSGSTAPAAGWLVGLPNVDGVLISSILRSEANFDKTAELQADLSEFDVHSYVARHSNTSMLIKLLSCRTSQLTAACWP